MKNLTKTLMFITALGCMQQMLPMGKHSNTYAPGGAIPEGSLPPITGAGDYKDATKITYNENTETAIVKTEHKTYYFANVKQQSQTVTPLNKDPFYAKLNLELFAIKPTPKKSNTKTRGGGYASNNIRLYGTCINNF